MKKKSPSWSPAEDLKLVKGLKEGYSFAALTSILGYNQRIIQLRCIELDLYVLERENLSEPSEITLKPNSSIRVPPAAAASGITLKTLLDNGWVAHCINGENVLYSPDWWRTRNTCLLAPEDEDTGQPHQKTSTHLIIGKPWTPDDTRVLLKAIQHGISKTALTELTLRSHQSTLQQLIELGMITVGAEDDSSSTVIWLNKKISSAKLAKKRFLEVLPLIEFGWYIDGFDLSAPDWWSKHRVLNEIIYEAVADKTISNYPARTDIGCDSEQTQQNKENSVPERNQRDPQKPAKWVRGNYKFLITLLSEHRSIEVIAKKMNRTDGAIRSRLQHIGMTRYEKPTKQVEKGSVIKATSISIDTFRNQPFFVKRLLIETGWSEKNNELHCPVWWSNYPHTV
ncbi:hypothetical protein OGV35_12510 [Citrobacter sp. Cb016]|uniref:hypothetical protein n=1 Tax=Enterobacteriaceae TaxID=543 RepID=UPI0015E5608D|nr:MULTISPECIES: hypothetical protein [Enterobacteriaceae]MDM3398571.1 hypothetical protein [Citrobacter sp. Cb016]QLO06808.1 hypothetical protein HV141_25385 [Citrobacter freundii]VVY56897.1 Uncharacterised protein [Escherichia coli]VVZ64592.1 Uncharacterised protein [Escherichia coli]VWN03902.1 Uncharacterised protein [Escherichia coli]